MHTQRTAQSVQCTVLCCQYQIFGIEDMDWVNPNYKQPAPSSSSLQKPSDKNLAQTMKAKCWLQCFAIFKWHFEILWKCLVLCFSPNTSLYRRFSENWVCLNVQWQWSFLYLVPHPVFPIKCIVFCVYLQLVWVHGFVHVSVFWCAHTHAHTYLH